MSQPILIWNGVRIAGPDFNAMVLAFGHGALPSLGVNHAGSLKGRQGLSQVERGAIWEGKATWYGEVD